MSLMTLAQACLAYGHVPLLDHADFALEANERVGLIGRNGTGKSTLLKILGQLEKPDDGLLQMRTGLRVTYVAQEPVLLPEHSVFEAVSAGLAQAIALRDRYQHADGMSADELHDLQTQIEALDGWTWEQRVDETLHRLGLEPGKRIRDLSGGLKKRVALAQALVAQPDVLLLDEPTNHLDMQAIAWLEGLLLAFKGSIVVISHDRAFLDAVTTRIVELDRGTLMSYPGNFAQYQVLKAEQLAQEAVINAKADKLLAQEEVWIRKGVEARRTRAQARIERLKVLREQRASRRDAVGRVRMEVATGQSSGKLVATLDKVNKSYAGPDGALRPIVRDFEATVLRGDKIGLIGPNGAGKTTLLKLVLGELPPDSGTAKLGTQLQIAYFDQMREQVNLDAALEDFISPGSEWIEIGGRRTHVKSYLGDFLFSPARAHAPVRTLSGGERNRLLLARLFARPANVLVLDEPTNDLDIDTLELLEDLLADYPGTVFLVSHDRRFLDNVVTSTWVAEGEGRWREYEGSVQDWLTQSARAAALNEAAQAKAAKQAGASSIGAAAASGDATAVVSGAAGASSGTSSGTATASTTTPSAAPKRKLSYKEQRELEQLPGLIDALEAEQKALDAELADPDLFVKQPDEAAKKAQRHADIDDELMAALERWEALGGA